jgi:hypothetical protein
LDLITVDFETYYGSKYSLKKLTTEEYIRSDEFEVIGEWINSGIKFTSDGAAAHMNSPDRIK